MDPQNYNMGQASGYFVSGPSYQQPMYQPAPQYSAPVMQQQFAAPPGFQQQYQPQPLYQQPYVAAPQYQPTPMPGTAAPQTGPTLAQCCSAAPQQQFQPAVAQPHSMQPQPSGSAAVQSGPMGQITLASQQPQQQPTVQVPQQQQPPNQLAEGQPQLVMMQPTGPSPAAGLPATKTEPMMVDGNSVPPFPALNSPHQRNYTINGKPRADGSRASQSSGRLSPLSSRNKRRSQADRRGRRRHSAEAPRVFKADTPLPGQFTKLSNGNIHYQEPNSTEVCIFYQKRPAPHHSKYQQSTLHTSGSIYITASLTEPDLPAPSADMHHALKSNVAMCFRPKLRSFPHGHSFSCDCIAQCITDVAHRMSVVPLYCAKRIRLSVRDMEVPLPPFAPRFYENASRTFVYSEATRCHVLALPQPFAASVRWPPKAHLPALATCDVDYKLRDFFALFDADSYREAALPYLMTPDRWTPDVHPFYQEPPEHSELYLVSQKMWGIETLFRVSPPRHPCRVKTIYVYPATNPELVTPTLTTNDKFAADLFLSTIMRPFYAQGFGVALCAVCLVRRSRNSDVAQPAFFTREDYILHFRAEHWNHSALTGLHSPTQLNTRMYLAMFLYTLCLGHVPTSPDPRKPACNDPGLFPGFSTSIILRNLVSVPENNMLSELYSDLIEPDEPLAGSSAPAASASADSAPAGHKKKR